jgi:hypothetical protein
MAVAWVSGRAANLDPHVPTSVRTAMANEIALLLDPPAKTRR